MFLDGLRHVGQSRGYVYDSTVLAWIAAVQAGSGGAGSTTVNISSVAGAVIVRSSAADFAATVSGNVGQASTVWAAQIDGRVRAQNSTIGDFLASVQQNSTVWAIQADGRIRAQNSTIGDFLASVAQNSTVWAVQVDGRVRAQNSTIGDLLASVQQNSTTWVTQARLFDANSVGVVTSSGLASSGAIGLLTRAIVDDSTTFAASTVGANSTATTIESSNAATKARVYAYSITSTERTAITCGFYSSNTLLWPVHLQAVTSAVMGANLAVSPQGGGCLFKNSNGNALTFNISGAAGPIFHVGVSLTRGI